MCLHWNLWCPDWDWVEFMATISGGQRVTLTSSIDSRRKTPEIFVRQSLFGCPGTVADAVVTSTCVQASPHAGLAPPCNQAYWSQLTWAKLPVNTQIKYNIYNITANLSHRMPNTKSTIPSYSLAVNHSFSFLDKKYIDKMDQNVIWVII